MKTLIFSDSHLDDRFDEKKYQFLKRIIESVDRVIINGDFWDGYTISFEKFIKSNWQILFPLLKKKQTVYVFGNHDSKNMTNDKVKLFSTSTTLSYKFKSGTRSFIVEHGDQMAPMVDEFIRDKFKKEPPKILNLVFETIERFMVRTFGKSYLKNYARFNNIIKIKFNKRRKNNEYIVCGHTHFAEIDLKNHFINSGFIKHGVGQYIILDRGVIAARDERY